MDNSSNYYSIKNIIFIIIISFASLVYFPLCQIILPAKFHFDSGIIRNGISNPQLGSGSYRSTSTFFRILGFSSDTPLILVQIFSWIIFILILITILRINNHKNFSLGQSMFILFFTLMYGAYFVNYSKDIIVLLLFVLALNLPDFHNDILINILFVIFIYGCLFRTYWLIILIIALSFLLINKFLISNGNLKIKRNFFLLCSLMIFFIFLYNIIKKSQVSQIRESINQFRVYNINANNIARSIINNLLSNTSVFTDIINYLYVLISLIIPVQGFPSLSVIVYYVWIIGLFIEFIKNKRHINMKIFFIFVIYINIQALFEPDFGSVFRHQLAWFPIIYYALNDIKIKN